MTLSLKTLFSATVLAVLFVAGCDTTDSSVGGKPSNIGSTNDCTAGDTKPADDGCNTCTCGDDGQWACTEIGCNTGECTDGDTKQADDGCNTCGCTDGQWACTAMACVDECTTDADCDSNCVPCGSDEVCSAGICSSGVCVYDQAPGCGNECVADTDCVVPEGPCLQCSDGSVTCPEAACIGGMCVVSQSSCPDPGNQCSADSDCVQIQAPCTPCPDGSYSCPMVSCENGQCVGSFPGCEGAINCGGFSGQTCPDGMVCVDQPDDCDPAMGADCPGVCAPGCSQDADCAAPAGPCTMCPGDDTYSCPTAACIAGQCAVSYPSCPDPNPMCASDSDCVQILGPCELCSDGSYACPSVSCEAGQCVGSYPSCAEPAPCPMTPPDTELSACFALNQVCDYQDVTCVCNSAADPTQPTWQCTQFGP